MKEFGEITRRMSVLADRSRHFRLAASQLQETAVADLKKAQADHARLVELRDGMLKEALARDRLVICGNDDHRVMDEVEPGDEQPTAEQLGIISADQAELYYSRSMTTSGWNGDRLEGFRTTFEYRCSDHQLEDSSSPSRLPHLSTEPSFIVSRVTKGEDGKLLRTLNQVDVTDVVAGLDPIIGVLNERNRGTHHKDMAIEIYRHFEVPDLPQQPF